VIVNTNATSPALRIVALVECVRHVCTRYRVSAFLPALASAGIELTIKPLPRSLVTRLRLYRQVRGVDAIVLQRRLPSLAELVILRRMARRLVYDFDDAIWMRDSYSRRGFESSKRLRRFRAVVEAADEVFAGNAFLADQAGRFTDRPVTVIPTCVDPAGYPVADHPTHIGPPRLVWIGSSSTLQGLERFRPTLEAIGREVPGVRLRVVCDRFPTFEHLPVDAVPWSAATEARAIAGADIGIGWVPDDPWSQGKCGLKILQYQAAGLPVVANPVGVQADLVRTGETGFLAETTDAWVAAVRSLADPLLRQRLGRAGRRQVEEQYSVAVGGRLWVESLERLSGPVGSPTPG
jgi:glycosyltransferase involved in cell wall biosynthesis